MSTRRVEFHPAAERDAAGARAWYAERSVVAAHAFAAELIETIQRIAELPERWPQYLAGTRRCGLPRFPYSIVYRADSDAITVIAVVHHRRKPGFWVKR